MSPPTTAAVLLLCALVAPHVCMRARAQRQAATAVAGPSSRATGQCQVRPLPCGVLWVLHTPKTGGGTVKTALRKASRVSKHGLWHYADLYR